MTKGHKIPKDLPRIKYDTPQGYNGNLAHALAGLEALHDQLEDLERAVVMQKQRIEQAWKLVPALQVRPWRPCNKCSRPTQDRLGIKAWCAKHVAGGDGMASVITELLNG
jgi:hypothetical protein